VIRDLVGAGAVRREADVLVIGGGTVGLVMAAALAKRGLSVVCLESGGEQQEQDTHPLNAVEQLRTMYAGAEHGRFRCLGGTSTRWGGALIPFAPADLNPTLWPVSMAELAPYQAKVEQLFGLDAGPYDSPEVLGKDADHMARLAKWPPFRKRNVMTLVGDSVRSAYGPEIWLNATACRFSATGTHLEETVAKAPDGSTISVKAKEVLLASGAIESTRLLMLLDAQNNGRVEESTQFLGQGFFDHLSAVVATVDAVDRRALNRLVGFRFGAGGTMRNMRFELSGTTALRHTVPACFAHVAFDASDRGGFSELRDLFRVLQRRRLPGPAQLARLAAETPWLVQAAYWRFVEKRLLYPSKAQIQLHIVIDQEAASANRITLSDPRQDRYGQPLACIDWGVSDIDRSRMSTATNALLHTWSMSPLQGIATHSRLPDAQVWRAMEDGGGIYHPGGTTRMAHTAKNGVVDDRLRVFGIPNLRVVATSVMPSGGGANPTMTLLMLGLRCVEDISAGPINRGTAIKWQTRENT
jgi:choline dehydrogenase-like flavoprotein